MRTRWFAGLAVAALAGCGGGDGAAPPATAVEAPPTATTTASDAPAETETEAATTAAAAEPLPGLPEELAGYEAWTRLNARPIPPRSPDPHSGTKNVYASVAAAGGRFPDGAIVVKEATRPGKDFVGLIAMMRKQGGAQPDHNDWVWVEWVRDRADEEFRVLARGGVCYGCHMQARETDYVFTRR